VDLCEYLANEGRGLQLKVEECFVVCDGFDPFVGFKLKKGD